MEVEAPALLLRHYDMLFYLLELLGDLSDLLLVGVDLLVEFNDLLPLDLLSIHLLQILHLDILVSLLIFSHSLLLLVFYELNLLIIQRIQLPLLIIVLPDLLQLRFLLLDLSVEALRTKQLVCLGLNLQVFVLDEFLDIEFAIAYLADIAPDLRLPRLPLQLTSIRDRPPFTIILFNLHVRGVHRVRPLLDAALRAVLQGAEVARLDVLCGFEGIAAAAAIGLV